MQNVSSPRSTSRRLIAEQHGVTSTRRCARPRRLEPRTRTRPASGAARPHPRRQGAAHGERPSARAARSAPAGRQLLGELLHRARLRHAGSSSARRSPSSTAVDTSTRCAPAVRRRAPEEHLRGARIPVGTRDAAACVAFVSRCDATSPSSCSRRGSDRARDRRGEERASAESPGRTSGRRTKRLAKPGLAELARAQAVGRLGDGLPADVDQLGQREEPVEHALVARCVVGTPTDSSRAAYASPSSRSTSVPTVRTMRRWRVRERLVRGEQRRHARVVGSALATGEVVGDVPVHRRARQVRPVCELLVRGRVAARIGNRIHEQLEAERHARRAA